MLIDRTRKIFVEEENLKIKGRGKKIDGA